MRRALSSLVVVAVSLACNKSTLTQSPGHLEVAAAGTVVSGGSDDFGQSCPGFPVTQTLTLENTGDVQVSVSNITLSGDFSLTPMPTYPIEVDPGGAATVSVAFGPTAGQSGGQAATMTFTSDAQNGTVTVSLHRHGVERRRGADLRLEL